ncbi:hypothetical protein D3C80_774510 [compost metagenome]
MTTTFIRKDLLAEIILTTGKLAEVTSGFNDELTGPLLAKLGKLTGELSVAFKSTEGKLTPFNVDTARAEFGGAAAEADGAAFSLLAELSEEEQLLVLLKILEMGGEK